MVWKQVFQVILTKFVYYHNEMRLWNRDNSVFHSIIEYSQAGVAKYSYDSVSLHSSDIGAKPMQFCIFQQENI
jgi:hypothetical protein